MAEVRLKGSGVKSFSEDDFAQGERVNYIADGKTAADVEEEPITGSLIFNGNAQPSQVESGYTFYNNSVYDKRTGTLSFSSASGTKASDVKKGDIFYTDIHTPLVGTLEFTGNAQPSEVEKNKTFYNNDLHAKRTGILEFTGNSVASDVEKGKTFYNNNLRNKITGTLEFTGNAVASQVESGYTFYNNDLHTKVTGTLNWNTATTSGSATTTQVLSGKTYYTNNLRNKITGTMRNNGAISVNLNSGGSYTIPSGYHNGSGKVNENSPYTQTAISSSGAGAAQIWAGKTAYVNGNIITGTGSAANTNSATGAAGELAITINWTFPSTGWYTGVCILMDRNRTTAPTSSTPASDSHKIYMGTGTKRSAGSYYYTVTGLSYYSYYSFSIYPYVVVNGTTYWYGSPTPRTIVGVKPNCSSYRSCNCNNKDCDGSCSCDGDCCRACTF